MSHQRFVRNEKMFEALLNTPAKHFTVKEIAVLLCGYIPEGGQLEFNSKLTETRLKGIQKSVKTRRRSKS